ncbi:hypothetical protein MERGE_000844 [Pneumocystis wakefieldiae]|uniref:CENP-T/Histone H4 histone fold domain-containing protein n=1 Tax=Pneumocystis wakefieldiae TaxID=38082 RepID=A0A899G1M8_9ASCO|nr:hypothetical protein MERGE_000844 [Pneumocystis wakefieldiae]
MDESSETPHTSLRQLSSILANEPHKPSSAAGKTGLSAHRTPVSRDRSGLRTGQTLHSITKKPPTPYTARALQKAAMPHSHLKKKNEHQRSHSTPRDILRKLSRALPSYVEKSERNDYELEDAFKDMYDFGNGEELEENMEPPNINIPSSEDISEEFSPPHFSIPLDQEHTVQSIELGRRASIKRLSDRLSLEKDSEHISIYNEHEANTTSFNEFALHDDELLKSESFFREEDLKMRFYRNDTIEDDPSNLDIPFLIEKSPMIAETMSFKDTLPEFSLPESTKPSTKQTSKIPSSSKKSKIQKVSRHGIPLPSLPMAFIRQLAANFTTLKISKDALKVICSASDQFFEQISEDLDAFAAHAGRKTVEDSDVIQLMKR